MAFVGRFGSSPEAKAADGGGPASPPLFWLMVVGSVWVDDCCSWSSLGRRSYTDSEIKDEADTACFKKEKICNSDSLTVIEIARAVSLSVTVQ